MWVWTGFGLAWAAAVIWTALRSERTGYDMRLVWVIERSQRPPKILYLDHDGIWVTEFAKALHFDSHTEAAKYIDEHQINRALPVEHGYL